MKINKRSGVATGRYNIQNPTILLYGAKGDQRGRRLANVIRLPRTARQDETRNIFFRIMSYATELTTQQRYEFASCYYSQAHRREIEDSIRIPSFQRKHQLNPSSWQMGFLVANELAAHSNMSWPRFKAAVMTAFSSPMPLLRNVRLDTVNWKITGDILIYNLEKRLKDARARLWVAMQYILGIRGYVHQIFNISPGENIIVPFEVDAVRTTGYRFGIEELKLSQILFGRVFIYADTVCAFGPQWCPKVSPYGDIASVEMPVRAKAKRVGAKKRRSVYAAVEGQKVAGPALDVLNYIYKYNRIRKKRMDPVNVIQGTNWVKFKKSK